MLLLWLLLLEIYTETSHMVLVFSKNGNDSNKTCMIVVTLGVGELNVFDLSTIMTKA